MLYKTRALAYALLLLPASLAFAEEGIEDILLRHVITAPIKMTYEQTRRIQFIQEPVATSGKLYITPQFFIMEQQQPTPVVVATDHKRLWAHNLKTSEKYSKSVVGLKRHDPAVDALIKGFLSGDMSGLKKHFTLTLNDEAGGQWVLTFTPKSFQAKHKYEAMIAKGLKGEKVSTITMKYKYGNTSRWLFHHQAVSEQVGQEIIQLLQASGKP